MTPPLYTVRSRRLSLLMLLGSAFCTTTGGYALPVDTFNVPSETRCKGERTCKRNLSNSSSLGGFLGMEVQNPAEGKGITLLEIKTGPSKGRVVWGAAGSPAGRLTLFWDGDPNPSQVSGAGLGCLNLLADGATAFILEDLAYSATCSKGTSAENAGSGERAGRMEADSTATLCPPLVVESKIFDATDPTGQRYSTSIIRRHHRMSGKDLRIPFSSFTQQGPNGGGRPTCVGAISLTIRADDLTKSVVTFGPIYTNGACQTGSCVLPPPFIPEETPISTPTVTPTAKQTPSLKVTPSPTAIESKLKPESKGVRREKESVSTAIEAVPKEVPRQVLPPVTEEFIFGEFVEHKAPVPTIRPSIKEPTRMLPIATPTVAVLNQVPQIQSTRRPPPTIDPLDLIP